MKIRHIIYTSVVVAAMLATSSAQQYLYYYNYNDVVRKDTISKIDSITYDSKKLKTFIGDSIAFEADKYDVDSMGFNPLLFITEALVFNSPDDSPRSICFSAKPEGEFTFDDVVWSCSDNSVAMLKDGSVYPKGEGNCVIEGVYGSRRVKCNVFVSGKKLIDGHPYVDLGLPSGNLWAIYNIESTSADYVGDYYSWGEPELKENFTEENRWTGYSYSDLMKDGIIDSLGNLTPKYDIATVQWGENWRMPTEKECFELYDYCDVYWGDVNGVNGTIFVSLFNGNVLFLPTSGKSTGYNTNDYWTATARNNSHSSAVFIAPYLRPWKFSGTRSLGFAVRPIVANTSSVDTVICFSKPEYCINNFSPLTLDFNSIPSGAVSAADVEWHSSDEGVATVKNGVVNPKSLGVCEISCKFKNKKIKCNVVVKKDELSVEHEYVDLGLSSGTLWATCNMGASKPEEFGDYYSWGDTDVKTSYTILNSNTNDIDSVVLANRGIINGSIRLTEKFDAAAVNWGDDWRIPTDAQVKELFLECDVEVSELNGKPGYKFTSMNNGNSIFVPFAGRKIKTEVYDSLDAPFYWTADSESAGDYIDGYPWGEKRQYRPDIPPSYYNYRTEVYYGMTIRPVRRLDVDFTLEDTTLTLNTTDWRKSFTMTFASNMKDAGDLEWTSSDSSIAIANCGYVFPVSGGECVITGRLREKTVSCKVRVLGVPYVDLGLPSGTLWAIYNMGSEKEDEAGNLYAWGDTIVRSKNYYVKSKWVNYSIEQLQSEGVIDDSLQLVDEYDPARILLGSSWRVPTKQQLEELKENCTIVQAKIDNNQIIKLVSKINGNSMYLPFNDPHNYSSEIWSSTIESGYDGTVYADELKFSHDSKKSFMYQKVLSGLYSVRPIYVGDIDDSVILTSTHKELTMKVSDTEINLEFSIIPENAFDVSDIEWTTSNKDVAVVKNGLVSPVAAGECVIKGSYKGQVLRYNVKVESETE